MGRIQRGWRLSVLAFGVVRGDSTLLVIALFGGLAALLAALAFGIPAALLYDREEHAVASILAVLGAYAATFLSVFFGVALAAAGAKVLDGENATFSDGIAAARSRVGPIAGWALVLLTVNLVISLIRERAGVAGEAIAGVAGVAWSLATFLVIPVLALEGLGPWAALKRSAALFRERWGEQITGNVAIGGIFALLGIVPAVVIGWLGWISGSNALQYVLFGVAIALVVVAVVLAQTVGSVFSVALYRYAATGAPSGPFSEQDLRASVRPRRVVLGAR
jgi:hypothetical protein